MSSLQHPGQSYPLGASVSELGVNLSLYSRDATGVELLLFDREDDDSPAYVIPIDPAANRTYHYWHTFVPGVKPGQLNARSKLPRLTTPPGAMTMLRGRTSRWMTPC